MTEHVLSLVSRRKCRDSGTQTSEVTVVDCETLTKADEGLYVQKHHRI